MKITSINYKKIFPGEIQFTNTTLGLEIVLNEGESAKEAFDLAKKTVEDWINPPKRQYPLTVQESIPVIDKNIERMEIAIDNTKTKAELIAIQPDIPVELLEYYTEKLTKLSE